MFMIRKTLLSLLLVHTFFLLAPSDARKRCIYPVPVRNFADYAKRSPLMVRATSIAMTSRNETTGRYDVTFRIFGTFSHRLSNFSFARGTNITIGPFGVGSNCMDITVGARYTLFLRVLRRVNYTLYRMTYNPLPYSLANARFFTRVRKGTISGKSYLLSGCRNLKSPQNGNIQYTQGQSHSVARCNNGFELQDVKVKLCNTKSMRWNIRAPFVCLRKAFSFSSTSSLSSMSLRKRLTLQGPRRLRTVSQKKIVATEEEVEEQQFNLRSRIPPPKKNATKTVTTTTPTTVLTTSTSSKKVRTNTPTLTQFSTSQAVTMENIRNITTLANYITTQQPHTTKMKHTQRDITTLANDITTEQLHTTKMKHAQRDITTLANDITTDQSHTTRMKHTQRDITTGVDDNTTKQTHTTQMKHTQRYITTAANEITTEQLHTTKMKHIQHDITTGTNATEQPSTAKMKPAHRDITTGANEIAAEQTHTTKMKPSRLPTSSLLVKTTTLLSSFSTKSFTNQINARPTPQIAKYFSTTTTKTSNNQEENESNYGNNFAKSSKDFSSQFFHRTTNIRSQVSTVSSSTPTTKIVKTTTEPPGDRESGTTIDVGQTEEKKVASTADNDAEVVGDSWTTYEGVKNIPLLGFGSSVVGCPTYEGSVFIHSVWSGGFDGTVQFSSLMEPIMGGWIVRLMFNVPVYDLEVYTVDIYATSRSYQEFCVLPKHYNKNVYQDLTVGFNGKSNALQGGAVAVLSRSFLLGGCKADELFDKNVGTLLPFDDQTGNQSLAWITNSTEFSLEPLDVNQGHHSSNEQVNGAIILPNFPNSNPIPLTVSALATSTPAQFTQNRDRRCSVASPSGFLPSGGNTTPLWKRNISNSSVDYNEILHKSILFYEAQRSGSLPKENRIPWRDDSDLKDGCSIGRDLTGGWYNSGGNVKSTPLIAFSTTLLAWGAIDYREAYMESEEMDNTLAQIRWATDYLFKCHIGIGHLVAQVGNYTLPQKDWNPPEDFDPEARPVYIANENSPGADVAADVAAALASASILFKSNDQSGYAETCLRHAMELYALAKNFSSEFQSPARDPQWVSPNNGINDDMAWAATWLYMATQNGSYLREAENRYLEMDQSKNLFYWGDKSRAVGVLLANLSSTPNLYRITSESYMRWILSNKQLTPSGLLWLDFPGTTMLAANTAFLCLQAMKFASHPTEAYNYYQFARRQLEELVGASGQSFVVGVGENFPRQPHHRGSSCPEDAVCSTDIFAYDDPNPHVLYGALVNGPSRDGSYFDRVGNFIHNNVDITYNAGFQSLAAGLKEASSRDWNTILQSSVTQ